MSQHGSETALFFKLLPNRWQNLLYISVHMLALLSLLLPMTIPFWWLVVIALFILANLIRLLRARRAGDILKYQPLSNEWSIGDISGKFQSVKLRRSGILKPWLAIFNIQSNMYRYRTLILLPTQANTAALHTLFVLYARQLNEVKEG